MPEDVRELRGIPIWLLREYVEDAGGAASDDGVLEGDGWTVRLEQIEDFQVGSLKVGQVRVTMRGTAQGLTRLLAQLEPRLVRAGG